MRQFCVRLRVWELRKLAKDGPGILHVVTGRITLWQNCKIAHHGNTVIESTYAILAYMQ